jgi:hypothetical protein
MTSTHRDYGNRLNESLLADELGHVLAAMDLVVAASDVPEDTVEAGRRSKHEKLKRFLHFQGTGVRR